MADFKKENEGEGSKTADKSYREGATAFAKQGNAFEKAQQAEQEVEADPNKFAEAERKGRAPGAGEDLKNDLDWKVKKQP